MGTEKCVDRFERHFDAPQPERRMRSRIQPDVTQFVIVQHDQKVCGKRAGVIQGFKCHARGQGAVADDGNDAAILAALRRRYGHAQRSADRGAGVTDAEGVVLALAARGEGRQPRVLFDGVQLRTPACQDLVRIGLVSYIPNQPVVGCIEHIMQRNCKFYSAQTSGKMAARAGKGGPELSFETLNGSIRLHTKAL